MYKEMVDGQESSSWTKKGSDITWRNTEVIRDVVLAYILEIQDKIALKERKRQINDKDIPKGNNLKYY